MSAEPMGGDDTKAAPADISSGQRAEPIPAGSSNQKQSFGKYEDAVELVRSRNPKATNFVIATVRQDYIKGRDLIIVGFDEGGPGLMNYVLKGRGELELFRNDAQLIDGLQRHASKPLISTAIFGSEVVPGFIALIITGCIVALVLMSPNNPQVPEILSSGLALILGFYFGKSTK
jgi:hypothetical protein